MNAGTYLVKLQIDVIFGGCGQVYPSMPKEAIKTLRSQKLSGCVQPCPGMSKEAFKTLISQKLMEV